MIVLSFTLPRIVWDFMSGSCGGRNFTPAVGRAQGRRFVVDIGGDGGSILILQLSSHVPCNKKITFEAKVI